MPDPDLTSLIHRCHLGDMSAFSELFQRCEGRIYRLAVTILRDADEAEDTVQDVFLRLFRQIGDFHSRFFASIYSNSVVFSAIT